jgi:hypothetical protein
MIFEAERFVGIPYDEADCFDLAVMVQRELFARKVQWPGPHPKGSRGQVAVIDRHRGDLAQRIDKPETGDAVLFTECVNGSSHYHIGTVFDADERWILHTQLRAGYSVLQRERDCLRLGLRLEGYYRWLTI